MPDYLPKAEAVLVVWFADHAVGQPESRCHGGRFRGGGQPLGDWSDIVDVTVQGKCCANGEGRAPR